MNKKRLLVLSSPSGGGKSTVARHLMKTFPNLQFSISATTRNKRPKETYGIEYYFLKKDDFLQKLKNNEFIEHEEIFGNYYGTLKTEVDRWLEADENLIFDVDVKGALNIKKHYPDISLLIFISPPDIETLEKRLRKRSTESDEEINTRLARAKMEIEMQDKFDYVIFNIELKDTLKQAEDICRKNLML